MIRMKREWNADAADDYDLRGFHVNIEPVQSVESVESVGKKSAADAAVQAVAVPPFVFAVGASGKSRYGITPKNRLLDASVNLFTC